MRKKLDNPWLMLVISLGVLIFLTIYMAFLNDILNAIYMLWQNLPKLNWTLVSSTALGTFVVSCIHTYLEERLYKPKARKVLRHAP